MELGDRVVYDLIQENTGPPANRIAVIAARCREAGYPEEEELEKAPTRKAG